MRKQVWRHYPNQFPTGVIPISAWEMWHRLIWSPENHLYLKLIGQFLTMSCQLWKNYFFMISFFKFQIYNKNKKDRWEKIDLGVGYWLSLFQRLTSAQNFSVGPYLSLKEGAETPPTPSLPQIYSPLLCALFSQPFGFSFIQILSYPLVPI